MTTALEAARRYAAQGFRPLPVWGVDGVEGMFRCQCRDPACKQRDAGKHEPPDTDGSWKDGAGSPLSSFQLGNNVALAMGPQPGKPDWLVALDADGPFDWSLLGPLPRTMTAKTPRGEHRLFWVPPFEPLGNWVDAFRTKPGPSLDIRYARGRIVVWPSRNAFGPYEWVEESPPGYLPKTALSAIYAARRAQGLPILPRWSRKGKTA